MSNRVITQTPEQVQSFQDRWRTRESTPTSGSGTSSPDPSSFINLFGPISFGDWWNALKAKNSKGSGSRTPKPTTPATPTPQWTFQPNPLDQAPPMPPMGGGGNPGLNVPPMQEWMSQPTAPPANPMPFTMPYGQWGN